MTYSTKELAANGVPEKRVGMRRWRKERGLTIRSMACMLEIDPGTLGRYELGKEKCVKLAKRYEAFIARWQAVPETQRQLDDIVRQQANRYRAAAHARCKARGYEVSEVA